MILVHPSHEVISPVDGDEILAFLEAAGRTCYKSERKTVTQKSAEAFTKMIIGRGHESVLEHRSISVRVICDRGVSHELVRHRLASYSQESTRFCDYNNGHVTFVLPPWCGWTDGIYDVETIEKLTGRAYLADNPELTWLLACRAAEVSYKSLRSRGWLPEMARSVLPSSLKTEIVMTMNLRQWRHFFRLRALGTTGRPHPQMSEITMPMLAHFRELLPAVFNDL